MHVKGLTMFLPHLTTNGFHLEALDLNTCPVFNARPIAPNQRLCIGDLHGNALKLLYLLVYHGVITNCTEEKYNRFKVLFDIFINPELYEAYELKDNYQLFLALIDSLELNNELIGRIDLIGDDLCDRWGNDLLTLKLYEKLSKEAFQLRILLSNHSFSFIQAFETKQDYAASVSVASKCASSMKNMHQLILGGVVSKQEVDQLLVQYYFPNMRILTYSIEETTPKPTITIVTHAPIVFDTIAALAQQFNVSYNDKTVLELADVIDEINAVFQQDYVQKSQISTLVEEIDHDNGLGIDHRLHPVLATIWNKAKVTAPKSHGNYNIRLVNGHEGYCNEDDMHVNLNSYFGMFGDCYNTEKIEHCEHAYYVSANKALSEKFLKDQKSMLQKVKSVFKPQKYEINDYVAPLLFTATGNKRRKKKSSIFCSFDVEVDEPPRTVSEETLKSIRIGF